MGYFKDKCAQMTPEALEELRCKTSYQWAVAIKKANCLQSDLNDIAELQAAARKPTNVRSIRLVPRSKLPEVLA